MQQTTIMAWIGKMNNICNAATEVVNKFVVRTDTPTQVNKLLSEISKIKDQTKKFILHKSKVKIPK